ATACSVATGSRSFARHFPIDMKWNAGDTVVERGVFGDRILFARPLRVISHDDDVLALSLPIGTRYFGVLFDNRETAYTDMLQGKTRSGPKTWERNHLLILVRPGDAYSVMGFWN